MSSRQVPTEEFEPREDALPKWARDKLALMRRLLAEERKANAELRGEIKETDTRVTARGHRAVREDRPLPRGAEIAFRPDPARPEYEVSCSLRGGVLNVRGYRGLVVRPFASNVVTIELEG